MYIHVRPLQETGTFVDVTPGSRRSPGASHMGALRGPIGAARDYYVRFRLLRFGLKTKGGPEMGMEDATAGGGGRGEAGRLLVRGVEIESSVHENPNC